MSATNHTPNLKLSQFIPLDKPAWLGDYNSDMSKIDTAVHKVQTQADSMETAVEQATTAAQAATQAAQAATEAAQDAADKAQDAETTANNVSGSATQALTIAQQAQAAAEKAQSDVAGKVDKAGDTMTGDLTIKKGSRETILGSGNSNSDYGVVLEEGGSPRAYLDQSGLGIGVNVNSFLISTNNPAYPNTTVFDVPTGGIRLNFPRNIKNVADPTEDQDVATKAYVDAHGGGKSTLLSENSFINYTKATVLEATGFTLGDVFFFTAIVNVTGIIEANENIFALKTNKATTNGNGLLFNATAMSTSQPLHTTQGSNVVNFSANNQVPVGLYIIMGTTRGDGT